MPAKSTDSERICSVTGLIETGRFSGLHAENSEALRLLRAPCKDGNYAAL